MEVTGYTETNVITNLSRCKNVLFNNIRHLPQLSLLMVTFAPDPSKDKRMLYPNKHSFTIHYTGESVGLSALCSALYSALNLKLTVVGAPAHV